MELTCLDIISNSWLLRFLIYLLARCCVFVLCCLFLFFLMVSHFEVYTNFSQIL